MGSADARQVAVGWGAARSPPWRGGWIARSLRSSKRKVAVHLFSGGSRRGAVRRRSGVEVLGEPPRGGEGGDRGENEGAPGELLDAVVAADVVTLGGEGAGLRGVGGGEEHG